MRKFFNGFKYAANGIYLAIMQERNLRFHICAAIYVYAFSFFYSFTKMQYALITVIVCGVIALEIVNSAIERLCDNPPPEKHDIAGVVKDMAAGAVLIFSIGAAVCGALLFWNTVIFINIFMFFANNLLILSAFILSVALSVWFIFHK